MLSAKLFATLAILQLGFAVLESRMPPKSVDVYFHATYFVIGHIHIMGATALASACFALVYLAASRWVLHPLNDSLGVTHFVFALTGFVLLSVALFSDYWQLFAFLVGGFCFLLGCATLALNCARTAITASSSPH